MVWGVYISTEFNEFFPRGELRGYRESLAAHFKAEPRPGLTPRHPLQYVFKTDRPLQPDGQPFLSFSSYMLFVTEKFHAEHGVPWGMCPNLTPIEPHEWPTEYVYEREYKRPASLIEMPNRIYAVEDALKDLIERLEPGVHQFHPIRVFLPKGREHPIRFHIMVVRRWLNSFSLEQSDPKRVLHLDSPSPIITSEKESYAGAAMSAEAMGDAHIWRERKLRGPTFFISDRFKTEAKDAGLRLPTNFRMKMA